MKKRLAIVVNKLNKHPVWSLTGDELELYFDHRVDRLVQDKKVLTRNELIYLLSETGPGNRRIDPRLITQRVGEDVLVATPYESMPEIMKLKEQKTKVEKYVLANTASENTKELIIKTLGKYIENIRTLSGSPFVIEADFGKTQISCIIRNGGWIFPDSELFSFIKSAQGKKRFPIVIAKKISGILFPVFKGISILGLNLYKTLLPEEAENIISNAVYKPKESFLSELKYNDQFRFLSNEYVENIQDEYWDGDPLKNFFENVLPKYIHTYSENFFNQKIIIANNFEDAVSQFKKSKASRGLLNSYKAQETILGAR